MAVKVEDGAKRATPVAVLHVLDRLGALDEIESEALDAFRRPNVTNTLGEEVGVIRADFQLEKPA
jgi:L-asparaginase II